MADNYPRPQNPYISQEIDDALMKEIMDACRESWKSSPAWMIGDYALAFVDKGGTRQEFLDKLDTDTVPQDESGWFDEHPVTAEQLESIVNVCIAFPGPVRHLDRTFFDHFCGWLLATHPDRVWEYIERLEADGGYADV